MLYGVICAGGILFSSDSHKTALIWPDARVGEPYQATLHVGELLQPEFSDSERLPDGLTLSLWYKREDINAGPSPLVDYATAIRDFADIYLRLEGTPAKPENTASPSSPIICLLCAAAAAPSTRCAFALNSVHALPVAAIGPLWRLFGYNL
ncbi:hypothetical protein GWD52_16795 [Enterobacteriaceae bacterium 4M9]|nr:hypothetical protein [Enterobacteriaceae bacterium 4M9]